MKQLADLTVPRQPVRKLLEKDVQKQCVDWARARGYWARKFSSMTQNSVPDYLFAKMADRLEEFGWVERNAVRIKFAVEFKAPRKHSTSAQIDEQTAMLLAGWDVFECDSFEKFKQTVIEYEQGAA